MEIVHEPARRRFVAKMDDGAKAGELTYTLEGSDLRANHTGTNPAFRGRGVATRLVEAAVAYARENGLRIVPICPFVASLFEKHPEQYRDIMKT